MIKTITAAMVMVAVLFGLPYMKQTTEPAPGFLALSGLDEMVEAVESGVGIAGVSYDVSALYGPDKKRVGFYTADREEVQALYEAITAIRLSSEAKFHRTDWYPHITFTLEDGRSFSVDFDYQHLRVPTDGYEIVPLENDEAFWDLVHDLCRR